MHRSCGVHGEAAPATHKTGTGWGRGAASKHTRARMHTCSRAHTTEAAHPQTPHARAGLLTSHLSAGQQGLEEVGGVHGARAAGPRPQQHVHFVDEKDDLAVGLLHLCKHGLQPLLKLDPHRAPKINDVAGT
jgi:hypothetical protein